MTGSEAAGRCQVSLLVPHPTRVAVLVADSGAPSETRSPPRLPTFLMGSAEPTLPDILAAVDVVDTATAVVLRLVVTDAGDSGDSGDSDRTTGSGEGEPDEIAVMVEFDTTTLDAPAGWTWRDVDPETIASLEPETSRAAVASWVRERTDGWSPLRPPWSRPGWLARASTWMTEQMAAVGRPLLDAPRPHQLWGPSVVLRAPTSDGDVFLKCSADIFRHEAVVTRALSERMAHLVPDVIAVDGDEGWLLMRDLGAAELGQQDESRWREGVVALAGIQRSWLGRVDELVTLGLPVRSLTDLAAQVEAMTEDDVLLPRLPAEARRSWLSSVPVLAESCRRLDEIGPGPTLVHGDFHPWNVACGPAGTRVFDWSDAAVSHPFVDLATYVFRTDDAAVRRGLVDAYVGAWAGVRSEKSLREAAALALAVGSLYQVQTYRTLLPALMGNGADDGLEGADLSWITRTLARQAHGLGSAT